MNKKSTQKIQKTNTQIIYTETYTKTYTRKFAKTQNKYTKHTQKTQK